MLVNITNPDTKEEYSYYMEKRLIKFLDKKVKTDLKKKDKDYVLGIDGYEGSGKSTFGQQIGRYVDPTLTLDRICMSAEDFKIAILNSKPNQCVIYDEAITGIGAGDSIRKVGRMLKSLMMQMRQKNLFVIIILPYIFDFSKYAVLGRTRAFFHIYERKGNRGYFAGYNKKDLRRLYLKGKKTYSYLVKTRFIGRFYGKYAIDEQEYRKKKEKSLQDIDKEDESSNSKYYKQRNVCIKLLYDKIGTLHGVADALKERHFPISHTQVGDIVRKSVENEGN